MDAVRGVQGVGGGSGVIDLFFNTGYSTRVSLEPDGRLVLVQSRKTGPDDVVILDREDALTMARAILVASEQETA